ncbi:S-layer homology domain-containing protein [Paenibacillus thiaminolyticus]|uniref:S-layer homology domain-containing protein n=1 Tax=Paenibacillus thiaminolyticus TaxID=49283 RepID=UPI0021758793|nr:S-layer homology domain-containing protein [Paenibacillus thiaminolyticus]
MEKPKQQDYEGHWAEASIRRVMDARIMNGRGNGFAPNEPITRAEIAVVADRLLKQMGKYGLGRVCCLLLIRAVESFLWLSP